MRAVFIILIVAVLALIGAIATGLIDIRQTQPAVAPGIESSNGKIITRPGQAPAFDVETGSIGVGAGNASVAVPRIEIQPGNTRVAVPSVQVNRPGAAPAAPAAPPAPTPPGNAAH